MTNGALKEEVEAALRETLDALGCREEYEQLSSYPKARAALETRALSLVSQAYEEAARTVDHNPLLPHDDFLHAEGYWEGYEQAERDKAKSVRALKDQLVQSEVASK